MTIRTPQRQHERVHRNPAVALSDCWECQRERAHCRTKRRYPDAPSAHEASIEINAETGWSRMLVPYPCPWCCAYHLTKAKPGTVRWKRAEKRRRRWLVEQRETA